MNRATRSAIAKEKKRDSLATGLVKNNPGMSNCKGAQSTNKTELTHVQIINELKNVFIENDLSKFPAKISPGGLDSRANYILENPDTFALKTTLNLRNNPIPDTLEPVLIDFVEDELNKRPRDRRLLTLFMRDFANFFENEVLSSNVKEKNNKDLTTKLLLQIFPKCRSLLITHLIDEFSGQFAISACVCFMVESGYAHMIRNYFCHILGDWETMVQLMPTPRVLKKNRLISLPPIEPEALAKSYNKFEDFLKRVEAAYPELFNGEHRLMREAENLEKKTENNFLCSVCFEEFSRDKAISCSIQNNNNNKDDCPMKKKPRLSTSKTSESNNEVIQHYFCLDCLRGQAEAATTEMPLSEGAIGLKCMHPKCLNPILFSECRAYIPKRIRLLLNDRIIEENLASSGLTNLERCKFCNFAIQIEASSDELRVFKCLKCEYEYCRKCGEAWKGGHFGKKCEELSKDTRLRAIENQMNEVVIRKCPKCALAFVKIDGCNKMTCRCGTTQCYVCRTSNINYNHFCQHVRTPLAPQLQCNKCKKTCLLWENVDKRTNDELQKITNEAARAGIVIKN